ncbi:MAG: hypothetical protein ACOCV4_06770 [Myxococcota bacterium]
MEQVTLRVGGLPLMDRGTEWPSCGWCASPMLFRAQLPLAVSGLVGLDDERVVLVFECHDDWRGEPCSEGIALIARGPVAPRSPPEGYLTHPVVIDPRGGVIVPFEDDTPGTHRTTLPALDSLAGSMDGGRLLGLLGGPAPGSRDPSVLCDCGRCTRTVVRLLGSDLPREGGVWLGPTSVQACLHCNKGDVLRMLVATA